MANLRFLTVLQDIASLKSFENFVGIISIKNLVVPDSQPSLSIKSWEFVDNLV